MLRELWKCDTFNILPIRVSNRSIPFPTFDKTNSFKIRNDSQIVFKQVEHYKVYTVHLAFISIWIKEYVSLIVMVLSQQAKTFVRFNDLHWMGYIKPDLVRFVERATSTDINVQRLRSEIWWNISVLWLNSFELSLPEETFLSWVTIGMVRITKDNKSTVKHTELGCEAYSLQF